MAVAANKKRVNITLKQKYAEMLDDLSRYEQVPSASKAAELLEQALEEQEDRLWAELAESRDVPGAKMYSHEEAWRVHTK